MRRSWSFRCLWVLACIRCFAPSALRAQQYTAEEMVGLVAEAMGGVARIDALETIRFGLQHLRFQDYDIVGWEIKRPNLLRKETTMSAWVFDGERACTVKQPPNEGGSPRGPAMLPADEWSHFVVDMALWFPAFFDYSPEYLGVRTVDGVESHVLQVNLPLGQTNTYLIDPRTFLPWKSIGTALEDAPFWWELRDFREVGGVLFPHAVALNGEVVRALQKVEFDVTLPDAGFVIPPGCSGAAVEELKGYS